MSFLKTIPDDEWEEVAQDIPSTSDPFLKKYIDGRHSLIDQEAKQRSDYGFKKSLSPLARQACEIVDRIRDEEQRTIWTDQYEGALAVQEDITIYPGMMFGLAKQRIESTRLWQIIRKMPKGTLLHSHFNALVDLDWLIDQVLATPGYHMFSSASLADKKVRDSYTTIIRFKWFKEERNSASIWSNDYNAESPILAVTAADTFPENGRDGYKKWLKDRCAISMGESVEHHLGVDEIWRKFMSSFRIIDSMINYEPTFRAYWQRVFTLLNEDGVRWTDVRGTFISPFYLEGQEDAQDSSRELVRVLGEALEDFKKSEAGKGFWGARIIWAAYRQADTRSIIEQMDRCIAAKLEFPDLIAGFDLVGQEDAGRPLKDLLPELFWFRKQCAMEGVDIPFFFHAGECLGDGNPTDQNLFDAILLGTRRIGHGFSLYKHPLLIDMVKEKKILIESCPISNEVLRLCGSIMSHPLPALLARGVTCALCNDDPGLLGQDTAGMTHDFWQALQGWQNLGLAGLGSLAENSVRYAAFEDQTNAEWQEDIREASLGNGVRAKYLKEWAVEWERFCLWIVTEYGNDEALDAKENE